ncbi:MAG: undecaprenyl-diphosphate phosphatase [Clostridia bacterium]|nr:undecaprenyl-diphosphate phosphatase [Clostridia bacterium]
MVIEVLKAILIGIVQGITEWLPVSSTGHMIIAKEFVSPGVSQGCWDLFLVVAQLASIIAVIILFFDKLNPWSKNKLDEQKKKTWKLWFYVIIAVVPTAILGIIIDKLILEKIIGDNQYIELIIISVALVVYGVLFIVIERINKNKKFKYETVYDIDVKTAIKIGCFQTLSVVPGTSRSGSTILGASTVGVSRTAAAEFSFFLAIPVMLGASALETLDFLLEGLSLTATDIWFLIVGSLTSFLVSFFVIRLLMAFVKKHSFEGFGWYRIVFGMFLFIYSIIKINI